MSQQIPPEVQAAIVTLVEYCVKKRRSAYKVMFYPTRPAEAAGFLVIALGSKQDARDLDSVVEAELTRQGNSPRSAEGGSFLATIRNPNDKAN